MAMITSSSSPGVYIEEKESGTKPIEVAGTSTAAFLGLTKTGVAMIPTPIESYAEYSDLFGAITEGATDPADPMALAVRAFFLNGGRFAYVVNVSKGGEYSRSRFEAGRGTNNSVPLSVPLYDVTAIGTGSHGNDISVVLTPDPTESPASGIFSLSVQVKGVEKENYKGSLAPGLKESLETTVNGASKLVSLTPDPDLEAYVFPCVAVPIEKNDIKALSNVSLSIDGYSSANTGPLDLTGMDGWSSERIAEHIQSQVRLRLKGTPYQSTPFDCKVIGGTDAAKVRCVLRTMDPNATFQFSPPIDKGSTSRADALSKLIRRGKTNAILKTAVLSGEIAQLKPTQLKRKALNVRVGNEFGRSMRFDSSLTEDTTLDALASILAQALTNRLAVAREALPTARVDHGSCVVTYGPLALPDAEVVGSTAVTVTAKGRTWTMEAKSPSTGDFAVTLSSHRSGDSFTITLTGDNLNESEKLAAAFNKAIEELAKLPTTTTERPGVVVEAVGKQLLIWDPDNDIEILGGNAAAMLGFTGNPGTKTAPLSDIQATLPIVRTLDGGKDGTEGNVDDYTNALERLEEKRDVSIICLPGNPWDKRADPTKGCWEKVEAAIHHAERQMDRMVIVDPPTPTSNDGQDQWKTESDVQNAELPTSSYCAAYYPWLDVLTGKTQTVKVAPCGFAAGVWSRTDMARGVWKAPAGLDAKIYGAQALAHDLTDTQGGNLNGQGVNCLRNISGYGQVVWGGRTRATLTEPQWRYLPVRRTALMIEDSLRDALLWAVHQPNKQDLWSALKINIEAFMDRLHRAGAFQPQSPKDAYFVRCGLGTTMTQADIDAGIVRVEVGFAPVKPAEFVVITIEQISEAR